MVLRNLFLSLSKDDPVSAATASLVPRQAQDEVC